VPPVDTQERVARLEKLLETIQFRSAELKASRSQEGALLPAAAPREEALEALARQEAARKDAERQAAERRDAERRDAEARAQAEQARREAEMEARRKAEQARLKAEEESRRKAEQLRAKAEEESRRKAEQLRMRAEEEARRKAELEAQQREEEARRQAEADRLAEEEALLAAEREAQERAEYEAKAAQRSRSSSGALDYDEEPTRIGEPMPIDLEQSRRPDSWAAASVPQTRSTPPPLVDADPFAATAVETPVMDEAFAEAPLAAPTPSQAPSASLAPPADRSTLPSTVPSMPAPRAGNRKAIGLVFGFILLAVVAAIVFLLLSNGKL
jgi:hypothetical protein